MKSVLALSAALVAASGAMADPAQDLALSPATPVVDVSPRRAGRQFLDLPALEYGFEVQARCDEAWTPESLTLNVADSRVTFGSGELSRNAHRKVTVNVPAQQLAPVAVHDFCLQQAGQRASEPGVAAPPASESSLLTIRAVLSAQASLVCVSEEERRITYVSQPLDVTLACRIPAAVETGD
jgi:hypothetical protein